jgi:hypothetical protein
MGEIQKFETTNDKSEVKFYEKLLNIKSKLMAKKQTDKLMSTLLGVSAFLIMLGAILKLEHTAYGNLILWIGIMASFILSNYEIARLKKRIKILEEESPKTDF